MVPIDLHIHSHYSDDGDFSPEELVKRCKEAGIAVMAISDHNSAKAGKAAEAAAAEAGIRYIPAIEIDCTFEGVNLHVLGYGIDGDSRDFAEIEENVAGQNRDASKARLLKIRALGFDLSEEDMLKAAGEGPWKYVWQGELFAEVLLSKPEYEASELLRPYRPGGSRSDNPFVNFYWDFCSQGKPCYVPIGYPSLERTLEVIHGNGGKAVLAHPGNNLKDRYSLLDPIVDAGMDGIEAFCSYHGPKERAYFLEYGRNRDRIITCGSDFHGKIKPAVSLGGHGCTLDKNTIMGYVERLACR